MITAFFLACTPSESDTASESPAEAPLSEPLRFVVIADPHVTSVDGDARVRLDRAVDWINAESDPRNLRVALVVGDIAWGDGLAPARESLDQLGIPWVPINGDNEIQAGFEEAYHLAFATHYEELATTLDAWVMGPVEVANPEFGVPSWFNNVAFSIGDVRFVGLDWASRQIHPFLGEFGALHDFEGGTWPFFEEQLVAAAEGPDENVVMFSHIPMHGGPFSLEQMDRITGVTAPLADHVWADLAGHYHADGSGTVEGTGYELHVTDATWDDDVEVRLVEMGGTTQRFEPVTETVVVP